MKKLRRKSKVMKPPVAAPKAPDALEQKIEVLRGSNPIWSGREVCDVLSELVARVVALEQRQTGQFMVTTGNVTTTGWLPWVEYPSKRRKRRKRRKRKK